MRTRTAPWDYKRNEQTAPYNDTCPICGHACYSGALPDGKRLYTCPQCINLEAAAAVAVEIPEEVRKSALSHLNNILSIDRAAIADEPDYADIAEKEADHRLEVEAARYGG